MNGIRKDARRPVNNYSNRKNYWNDPQNNQANRGRNQQSNESRGCPTRLAYSDLKTDIRWLG